MHPCNLFVIGVLLLEVYIYTCTSAIVFHYEHLCAAEPRGANVATGLLQSWESLVPGVTSDRCERSGHARWTACSSNALEVLLYFTMLHLLFHADVKMSAKEEICHMTDKVTIPRYSQKLFFFVRIITWKWALLSKVSRRWTLPSTYVGSIVTHPSPQVLACCPNCSRSTLETNAISREA